MSAELQLPDAPEGEICEGSAVRQVGTAPASRADHGADSEGTSHEAAATAVVRLQTGGGNATVRTSILPASGWQPIDLRELWRYRELIYFLTWRDVKVRYKQTLLGFAWAILQPAMMMVVFTVFFGRLAGVEHGRLPYPVFCYLGLLPWTFFATAVANAGNSVIGSERLISKIYFPRLAVPFAAVGAAVVDFLIAFGLLLVLMAWYGVRPTATIVVVPFIFAIIMLTALGVGTILAGLNVAYRDFRYVIPFLVQIWMFATPTIYMDPSGAGARGGGAALGAGGSLRTVLALNPMTGLVAAFRAACSGSPLPWGSLGLAALFSVVIFAAGCFNFRRMERTFADII
jgi:lipopolysaccharide transport system permease protein